MLKLSYLDSLLLDFINLMALTRFSLTLIDLTKSQFNVFIEYSEKYKKCSIDILPFIIGIE